jgi:hypothetical protein
MVTLDRIRLIGLLKKSPALRGFSIPGLSASPVQHEIEGSSRLEAGSISCYEHSSGAGAVMRWLSEPGGRRKIE